MLQNLLAVYAHTPTHEKIRFMIVEKKWERDAEEGLRLLQQIVIGILFPSHLSLFTLVDHTSGNIKLSQQMIRQILLFVWTSAKDCLAESSCSDAAIGALECVRHLVPQSDTDLRAQLHRYGQAFVYVLVHSTVYLLVATLSDENLTALSRLW